MFKAEDKLNQQNSKNISAKNSKSVKPKKTKKKKKVLNPRGKKPDVANLNITAKDDPLQFNKIEKIDDRSLIQIQQGIAEYNDGITALKNKNYKSAQNKLKEAEKRLKRGKIAEDGLNFSRGNLAIALLASGEKRGVGQAKRYLNNITSKIYKDRNWAYNLAVAHYDFGSRSKGATKKDFIDKSIKLFKTAIQKEKLNLPAYLNLVYIYNSIGEKGKALSAYKGFLKAENILLRELSKEEQINLGMDVRAIYRVKLGIFGVFDAPKELYDQEYLITVPMNEKQTGFFAGKFYNLRDAQKYQKMMQKNGFESASISSFREGEITEF
jgi:tetratricopeptide (TPR) repeat protein